MSTAEACNDGGFHTGDQFSLDADGNWAIIGRVKNLLVPESGHNVAPEPIEQLLMEHCDGVEQAVVIGHARPFLTAILTGDVDQATAQAGVDAANQALPHYRRIRGFHLTTERLTPENGLLTANQKLRRRVIVDHFASAIDEMYA